MQSGILTKSICKSMGGWFIYGAPSTPSEVLEDAGPIRARQARALKLMRKLLKNYASAPER
jgi:hypothetical protein